MKSKRYEEDKRIQLEEKRRKEREEQLNFPPVLNGTHRIILKTEGLLNLIQDLEEILLERYHEDNIAPMECLDDILYIDLFLETDDDKTQRLGIRNPMIIKNKRKEEK